MKVTDVAEELAARLRKIPGFTGVFPHPVDTVVPPAAIVVYPDEIEFDVTYQDCDRMTIPVVVVVGQTAHGRATRDALSGFWDGSGTQSVRAAIWAGGAEVPGVFDFARAVDARSGDVSIGGVAMLAAEFTVEVVGSA